MAERHFLAGVGKAILFRGNNLIGVAQTLTESTFNFSITGEEIRGGQGNALWGKFFHDSNLNVTLTDAMFNLEYIAASLGTNVQAGGISIMEEELAVAVGGSVTLSQTAIAFDGTMIGWYKLPTDSDWTIGTIQPGGTTMEIPGAQQNAHYCVKYFYQNENAKSIVIPVQYVPAELHVVILNDLYSGDVRDITTTSTRYGRLITDIPRLQMDGNQDLTLTATGAATVSLTGAALAVTSADTCEDEPYYGTMTEEIYGETWQDNVIALALEDAEVELNGSAATQTLAVRVIYSGSMPAERKDNSNFTFTVTEGTATGLTVGENTGLVTAGSTNGTGYVTVVLKDKADGPSAVAEVTVTGVG